MIVSEVGGVRSAQRRGAANQLVLGAKFAVTAACFWYVLHKINFSDLSRTATTLHLGWFGLATLAIMVEIPLVSWRWSAIVDVLLGSSGRGLSASRMLAITAAATFF